MLSLSCLSVSHRCIYHVYCTLSLSVCYVKISTAVLQSYSASCVCIVGLSALGTDNSSLLSCHLMHLSVLTTSLKLATEHPASQISTCLSTGECWLFTLLTVVKACAATFATSGWSDRRRVGVLSCYPTDLWKKVKRVDTADTKGTDITFEGAFCVWREGHVGNMAYLASHCRGIFEINQNANQYSS